MVCTTVKDPAQSLLASLKDQPKTFLASRPRALDMTSRPQSSHLQSPNTTAGDAELAAATIRLRKAKATGDLDLIRDAHADQIAIIAYLHTDAGRVARVKTLVEADSSLYSSSCITTDVYLDDELKSKLHSKKRVRPRPSRAILSPEELEKAALKAAGDAEQLPPDWRQRPLSARQIMLKRPGHRTAHKHDRVAHKHEPRPRDKNKAKRPRPGPYAPTSWSACPSEEYGDDEEDEDASDSDSPTTSPAPLFTTAVIKKVQPALKREATKTKKGREKTHKAAKRVFAKAAATAKVESYNREAQELKKVNRKVAKGAKARAKVASSATVVSARAFSTVASSVVSSAKEGSDVAEDDEETEVLDLTAKDDDDEYGGGYDYQQFVELWALTYPNWDEDKEAEAATVEAAKHQGFDDSRPVSLLNWEEDDEEKPAWNYGGGTSDAGNVAVQSSVLSDLEENVTDFEGFPD